MENLLEKFKIYSLNIFMLNHLPVTKHKLFLGYCVSNVPKISKTSVVLMIIHFLFLSIFVSESLS